MSNSNYIISSDLFLNPPSLTKGLSRSYNMFPTKEYRYHHSGKEADSNAIRKDWSIIGKDIVNAIKTYGKKESTPEK